MLAPGGRLLASVPAYQWAWTQHVVDNAHHCRYTRPRLVSALERAGFGVDRVTYAFAAVFPFFAAGRLARRAHERPTNPATVAMRSGAAEKAVTDLAHGPSGREALTPALATPA